MFNLSVPFDFIKVTLTWSFIIKMFQQLQPPDAGGAAGCNRGQLFKHGMRGGLERPVSVGAERDGFPRGRRRGVQERVREVWELGVLLQRCVCYSEHLQAVVVFGVV